MTFCLRMGTSALKGPASLISTRFTILSSFLLKCLCGRPEMDRLIFKEMLVERVNDSWLTVILCGLN